MAHELSPVERVLLADSNCELCCIDTTLHSVKYRFIVVYRPPSSSFKDRNDLISKTQLLLVDLLNILTHPHHTTILLGDFNLP